MPATHVDLLFVLVHYRTPERLRVAVDEAEAELGRLGLEAEVIVVDNSGDAELNRQKCTVLNPGYNSGYAAAANLAIRSRRSRYVVLANPDVTMEPGALGLLLAECRDHGAVGPAFHWDRERRLQLPPTEDLGARWWERLAAGVSPKASEEMVRRRWRAHARRHWSASAPIESRHLSGALLLFARDALAQVGPLDESYQLYFEETDWLRRAAELGIRTAYVPQAKALHTFDLSAGSEPKAQQWFAQSEALYRKRYGLHGLRAHAPVASSAEQSAESNLAVTLESLLVPEGCSGLWIELSGSATGFPAAAERLGREALVDRGCGNGGRLNWSVPNDLSARVTGWRMTVIDDRGRQLGAAHL